MAKAGLVDGVDAICSRVTVVEDLRAAVGDVDYVQESVFERVEEKRAVSEAIGALIRDDAVVGSSSSGIPASAFTEHAPRRERFLIAHPVNPPHLVPLVELVPAPWTDPAIIPWLRAAILPGRYFFAPSLLLCIPICFRGWGYVPCAWQRGGRPVALL